MRINPDLTRFSDWHEAVELCRSSAYVLLRETGVNPKKVRVPGSRAKVSFLTSAQREKLERELIKRRAADQPWAKAKKPLEELVEPPESPEERIKELERENAALRAALKELL